MANCVENEVVGTDLLYEKYNITEASGNSSLGTVTSYGYSVDMSGDWNKKSTTSPRISDYDKFFQTAGNRLKIDWRIIAAIAKKESSFRPNASNGSHVGLFQFSEDAWDTYAPAPFRTKYDQRKDPSASTQAFSNMFADNLEKHRKAVSRNDQIALAIQSHHDGSAIGTQWSTRSLEGTKKYPDLRKTKESLQYVPQVIGFYKEFCRK